MAKNISFGGFEQNTPNEGPYHKAKDFPPRDLPRPIDTKPAPSWNVEVDKEKNSASLNNGIVSIVNLILPVIGLTILIGGIIGVSFFVFNIYN